MRKKSFSLAHLVIELKELCDDGKVRDFLEPISTSADTLVLSWRRLLRRQAW